MKLLFVFIVIFYYPQIIFAGDCSDKISRLETIGNVKSALRCLESENSTLKVQLLKLSNQVIDTNNSVINNIAKISTLENEKKTARRLKCEVNKESSNIVQYPTVSANIPANRLAEGYVRVGGGCEIERGGKPGIPHNATMLKSIPLPNGWSCAAGDPPNIPLPTRIEAHVIFCKLK